MPRKGYLNTKIEVFARTAVSSKKLNPTIGEMEFLPYIYEPSKSIDVYEKTMSYLGSNSALEKRIQKLGLAYHNVGEIIPQTTENFWSGHFFPFSESWNELQVSFNLLCLGLYKQAFVSLRSGLELGLLSVYFNIDDEGHRIVSDWLNAEDSYDANTPRSSKIWKVLLSNENIRAFNDVHNLKQFFEDLGYLHNYVHTKGAKYSNEMGLFKSNFQTFEPSIIEEWLESYSRIVTLVATLHILKYPIVLTDFDYSKKFGADIPGFGFVANHSIGIIMEILPDGYTRDLKKAAVNDPKTIGLLHKLGSMLDLTEDELENQSLEMDKLLIKNGLGFNRWLENHYSILGLIDKNEFDEKEIKRIKMLREWATNNNYLESKAKRIGLEE